MIHKFRGQRKDNGEWVYGDYCQWQDRHYIAKPYESGFSGGELITYDLAGWHRVIPETVGQYTGLKDKNGTEGYQGDVTEDENGDRHVVEWDNDTGVNYLRSLSLGVCDKELYAIIEQKIIGNIHSDPKLLETN